MYNLKNCSNISQNYMQKISTHISITNDEVYLVFTFIFSITHISITNDEVYLVNGYFLLYLAVIYFWSRIRSAICMITRLFSLPGRKKRIQLCFTTNYYFFLIICLKYLNNILHVGKRSFFLSSNFRQIFYKSMDTDYVAALMYLSSGWGSSLTLFFIGTQMDTEIYKYLPKC